LAFLEAFALLKRRSVLVLTITAIVISMIHNIYFIRTASWLETVGFTKANAPAAMTVGQMVEIATLAVLGWFIARLGFRRVLLIGAAAYYLRFACFAMAGGPALAYVGIALHGFCYAFFFATVYIYIDAAFPKDIRTSAQGLFNFLILGIGDLAAKWIFIPLSGKFLNGSGFEGYRELFLVPVGMSLAAALLLALFFRPSAFGPSGNASAAAAPH
jgi:MFS family permease